MSRSQWKGPVLNKSLIKKKIKNKIWSRNCTIPFFLLGFSVFVHSGKDFRKIFITREKVGYKFGEFVLTRKHKNFNSK